MLLNLLLSFATPFAAPLPAAETLPLWQAEETQQEEGTEEGAEELSPKEIAEAIKEALKGDDASVAVNILKNQGVVADKVVVKAVGGGFSHKDPAVRLEALRALRFNEDKYALSQLLKIGKDKKLMDDPKFAAEYYMALGQKGDSKAISTIVKNLVLDNGGNQVTKARLISLGKIRDKKSVEELMSFMVQGKARRQNPYMKEISVSLVILTGEMYRARDQWQAWWNDNKRTFKVAKEPAALPKNEQRKWDMLWRHPDEIKERMNQRRGGKDKDGEGEGESEDGKEKRGGKKGRDGAGGVESDD
ncbi:MAG: hypothetical protein DWQ01_08780 [Planctomycetota bacterium]|nr:MAG: hypothetical protein DWQ01_08780 [Planctomycetota bacterium]